MKKVHLLYFSATILLSFAYTFGYSQYQKEGIIDNFTAAFLNNDSIHQEKPNWREFTRVWFKDSCIIYELRINYETRDQSLEQTTIKKSYPVWRYVYLDLRTMICQDYSSFKDTAMPYCNYFLKPTDISSVWEFYKNEKRYNSLDVITDTVINNTVFKRTKMFYNTPAKYYSIYYLNCNAQKNMFDLDKSLNEMFPDCKTMMIEGFNLNGKLQNRTEYKIISDTLTADEKKIFQKWQQNACKIQLPLLSYEEARKSCVATYDHENPTITIIPNK